MRHFKPLLYVDLGAPDWCTIKRLEYLIGAERVECSIHSAAHKLKARAHNGRNSAKTPIVGESLAIKPWGVARPGLLVTVSAATCYNPLNFRPSSRYAGN